MLAQIFDLIHLRREQAEVEHQNMRESVEAKREEEKERDGLLIINARYGNLDSPGSFIDVTDQLQNLVDCSRLIFKGNKDFMEGCWDPTFMQGDVKTMQITYQFQDTVHEVYLGAEDEIVLPLKSHALTEEELEERKQMKAEKEVRRKRRQAVKSAFVCGMMDWNKSVSH